MIWIEVIREDEMNRIGLNVDNYYSFGLELIDISHKEKLYRFEVKNGFSYLRRCMEFKGIKTETE